LAMTSLLEALPRPEEAKRTAKPRPPPRTTQMRARPVTRPPTQMKEVKPSTPRPKARVSSKSKTDTARGKTSSGKKTTRSPRKDAKPARTRAAGRRQPVEKAVPLDEWERYVRDFIKTYDCTPEQTHSALSILGELKDRASRHERAATAQTDRANSIKDRRKRKKRLDEINAPINRLFNQLKRRLDGLLTSHQRAIKRANESKSSRRTRRR